MQPRLKQLFVEAGLNPGQLVQLNAGGTAWAAGLRFTATNSSPVLGSDSSVGYGEGSIWINTTSNEAFICVDASVGAAIWNEIALGGNVYQEDYVANVITGTDTNLTNPAANLPIKSLQSFRLYMNGILQQEGAGNDYTVVLATGVVTWLANTGTAVDLDANDTMTYVYESNT